METTASPRKSVLVFIYCAVILDVLVRGILLPVRLAKRFAFARRTVFIGGRMAVRGLLLALRSAKATSSVSVVTEPSVS